MTFKNKTIVVTGGTGSLGQRLVKRLLMLGDDMPSSVIVFSRDEAKQHSMRTDYSNQMALTDEAIYHAAEDVLKFVLGDIRDYSSIVQAIKKADIVIHAAALKQVPTCEYFPMEAVKTNVNGASNLVRAVQENDNNIETVIGISTDKACQPLTVMGTTKALQESIFISANLHDNRTNFSCVRYGNVIGSRGSVVPLFREQIKNGMPVTVTMSEMTRFIIDLDQAVDTVFSTVKHSNPGEIFVPQIPSARIVDLANAFACGKEIKIIYTGIRPNEKMHEVLISEEEGMRTSTREGYFIIAPDLPELKMPIEIDFPVEGDYTSQNNSLEVGDLQNLLASWGYLN